MGCLGVHYAITDTQRAALEACQDDEARIEHVNEVLGETCDEDYLVDTDKAWDAIHRCLAEYPPNTPWFYPVSNGEAHMLPEDCGSYPLKLAILGGRKLMDDEHLYFMRLVEPDEVADVADALEAIDEAEFKRRYFRHCEGAWPEYGEDDAQYSWEYFQDVRAFFRRMTGSGRTILFTADQ